jgi:hypothetical protein
MSLIVPNGSGSGSGALLAHVGKHEQYGPVSPLPTKDCNRLQLLYAARLPA